MKYINQRQSPRVEIRLRCRVSIPGLCHGSRMVTENISRCGILVAWKTESQAGALPEVGQLATVDIELPAHHGFGRKCIHCQAVVVRVSRSSKEAARVALSVNYMKFRTDREPLPAVERLEPAGAWGWLS